MEEPEDLSQVSKLPPQLTQVKQWFEANKEQLRIRDGGASFRTESQELILPLFEKEPDWEQVHQYSFPDGREVFEISLANAQKYFPAYLKDSLHLTDPSGAVIQNIMFVKNPENGSFDPLIARYYPENEESIRGFGEIYYNKIPLEWSGLVDIWTYDERHFIGFYLKDGLPYSISKLNRSLEEDGGIFPNHETQRTTDCFTRPRVVATYITGINNGIQLNYVVANETICIPVSGGSLGHQTTYYEYSETINSSGGSDLGNGHNQNDPSYNIPSPNDPEELRKMQLDYLRSHGASGFVEFIENLLKTSGLTMTDVFEINELVKTIYLQQKANFMLAIFSAENVGIILSLAFSNNISPQLRNSIFNGITRYSAYNEIFLMVGNKTWEFNGIRIVFSGYTNHGAISYGISKGLSPSLIRNILANGNPVLVPYQNGYQLRLLLQYESKTIAIAIDANVGSQNFGKITTYLTNY